MFQGSNSSMRLTGWSAMRGALGADRPPDRDLSVSQNRSGCRSPPHVMIRELRSLGYRVEPLVSTV
jgi:hypothetical protein